MQRFRYPAILLSLVIVLMACQLAQAVSILPEGQFRAATPTRELEAATQSEPIDPAETQPSGTAGPARAGRDKPVQSRAAEIRPPNMRIALTHLSNLIGYKVLDENGDQLGVASDYIVNTCETYIIYILMEPVASLNVASGSLVVIPFEAVTINSGVLDAGNKSIQLKLLPEQFSGAPTLPAGHALSPSDWEPGVRAFWSEAVRVGVLATSCNVSGGPVYKVAYASQLLGVELYDGQNNLLGVVEEAILEPESGKIGFYVVKPAGPTPGAGDGLVMVRLQATNIPKEALLPGSTLTLVLLVDPKVFWDAPRITSLDEADDVAVQGKMRQYWSR